MNEQAMSADSTEYLPSNLNQHLHQPVRVEKDLFCEEVEMAKFEIYERFIRENGDSNKLIRDIQSLMQIGWSGSKIISHLLNIADDYEELKLFEIRALVEGVQSDSSKSKGRRPSTSARTSESSSGYGVCYYNDFSDHFDYRYQQNSEIDWCADYNNSLSQTHKDGWFYSD
jgi:hypothetical protein